jgi:hypothetical protein
MKTWRAKRVEHPPFGVQVAFARAATEFSEVCCWGGGRHGGYSTCRMSVRSRRP